jgi:uncharacterized membrane protein
VNPWWNIIFLSLAPVVENRGAILVASAAGLSPVLAFYLATSANLVVIPIYYLLLLRGMEKIVTVAWIDTYIGTRRNRVQPYIDRYGWLGLAIFVAVPLPGTGWYTGGLVAAAIGFRPAKGILGLWLGCIGAGVITLLPSLGIHFALF